MRRSNRTRQHHISRTRPALAWGRNFKVTPLRYLSETLRAVQSRGKTAAGSRQAGKGTAAPGSRFGEETHSAPGASPSPGHTPDERRAPGRPRPTCPRQAPARGPSFVRSSPRCRSPRAPFPPPGRAAPSAGAGPTPELTCGGCGVGSAARRGSLGSARGPLAQPPGTPHRRPEPALPECRVCPDGRWAPGARARPQATRARGPRRRGVPAVRPGAATGLERGIPGSCGPELAARLVATARVQRRRGARNPGAPPPAPRPAPPPRPPQPAAARDAPPEGSSPAPDRPPHLPPAPGTPRPPARRLCWDRAQQPRVDVECGRVTYRTLRTPKPQSDPGTISTLQTLVSPSRWSGHFIKHPHRQDSDARIVLEGKASART